MISFRIGLIRLPVTTPVMKAASSEVREEQGGVEAADPGHMAAAGLGEVGSGPAGGAGGRVHGHGRVDQAGHDGVDPDAVAGVSGGHRLGQLVDPAFDT